MMRSGSRALKCHSVRRDVSKNREHIARLACKQTVESSWDLFSRGLPSEERGCSSLLLHASEPKCWENAGSRVMYNDQDIPARVLPNESHRCSMRVRLSADIGHRLLDCSLLAPVQVLLMIHHTTVNRVRLFVWNLN